MTDSADPDADDLLTALVKMVRQYLREMPDGLVETKSMSAGEHAIDALVRRGLMEWVHPTGYGRWTDAGQEFWDSIP